MVRIDDLVADVEITVATDHEGHPKPCEREGQTPNYFLDCR